MPGYVYLCLYMTSNSTMSDVILKLQTKQLVQYTSCIGKVGNMISEMAYSYTC